jgi:hypothetical protein
MLERARSLGMTIFFEPRALRACGASRVRIRRAAGFAPGLARVRRALSNTSAE